MANANFTQPIVNTQLPPAPDFQLLALEDGAFFVPSGTGEWSARDKYGTPVVEGALSRAEAARQYCELQGLVEEGGAA
jgi:hypothetical protein